MTVRKCKGCGATENLIEHHLCYVPNITVVLCRSCHSLVHWSPDRAKKYDYDRIFRKDDSRQGHDALFLRNKLIATIGYTGLCHCMLCSLGGKSSSFETESEFLFHFIKAHPHSYKEEEWGKLAEWKDGIII